MPMSVTTRPSAPQALIAPVTAALAVGTVVLALLFLPEGRAAVGVWLASTAYGHCFLVLPMAMYLAWDRRESVRGIAARRVEARGLVDEVPQDGLLRAFHQTRPQSSASMSVWLQSHGTQPPVAVFMST